MHIFDVAHRFMGGYALVGGPFPLAAGIAKGIQMKGGDEIAICFLGDAANNQGTFHETMNMAALYKLPVLFVCENNLYGIGTAIERSTAVVHQHKRVCGYDITASETDGQDIEKVYEAAKIAVNHVRAGKGPYFLELMTYRYRGHSMSDSRGYRSREEEEMWKQRDPIFILRDRLIAEGAMTMADYEALEKETDAYIENEVIRFAEESPEPRVEDLEKYVFAERDTQLCWLTGQA
jgi:pyruvate dehydrogenase E1 component alpha subunit